MNKLLISLNPLRSNKNMGSSSRQAIPQEELFARDTLIWQIDARTHFDAAKPNISAQKTEKEAWSARPENHRKIIWRMKSICLCDRKRVLAMTQIPYQLLAKVDDEMNIPCRNQVTKAPAEGASHVNARS